jgi:sec-independent protein translocase protein TatA
VGNLGPWEILIIAGVIVLLFGARKMPEMARSLGKSARILRAETKGMRGDESVEEIEAAKPAQQQSEVDRLREELEAAKLREEIAAAEARAKAHEQGAKPADSVDQTQANKNAS